ncbi:MAG: ABC transporter substrate-binding protein [Thermomicrobiales bacterium]
MTDERLKTLETIGRLVSEGKIDRRRLFQTAAALGLTGAVGGASVASTASSAMAQDSGDLNLVTISQEQQATWIKNFNPLNSADTSRWPTQGGIYEPMAIYSTPQGQLNPWLADSWEFSEDGLTLTFHMHPGVNWSDGTPLTAQDVKFTFDLLMSNEALVGTGAIRTALPHLSGVEAPDDATVVFTFSEVFTLALYDIAEQMIVPKHIWETIEDPVAELNEVPVGSGPFTNVGRFEAQYWELLKNENYWQEGKPMIDGFRFPSYPTNDAAMLGSLNGENDWFANFIPDIENTFVSKDPENFHYWFPSYGATVHLWLNTTVAPFDSVDVRKGISQAIDRAQIVNIAMYDYTHPADSSGLSDAFPAFKTEDASTQGAWVTLDVDAANAALDAAGLTKDGDVRKTADGTSMEYELLVVTGWSDWVAACEIMAANLAEVGIKATVTPLDFNAWYDKVTKGEFDMSIGWSDGGATPYSFYIGCMSTATVQPVGTLSPQNWQRFGSEEADALLAEMAATSDLEAQKAIVAQLQELYNQNAPGVPLFPGPQWGEFVTLRFDGFPNADNPYAILSTYDNPERLTVMTTIAPIAAE